MDEIVARALARWPDTPDVYGWCALDARGNWLLRHPSSGTFERIGNAALRAYIGRNYASDARGAWFFQNGPQRVFVRLHVTPLIFRLDADRLVDQCGLVRPPMRSAWIDELGALVIRDERGIGLLNDRDLPVMTEHIVDGMGMPIGDGLLFLLHQHDEATDLAWIAFGGVRARLGMILRADLPSRFCFVPEPES